MPSGVAVLAKNTYAARRGRDALEVKWDEGEGASFSTERLAEEYRMLAASPGGAVAAKIGDAEGTLANSKQVVEAVYELPFLAHVCMEPLNCVAHVTQDKCEIWTGTQWQSGDAAFAAAPLGMKPEQIVVHTTFLGGGFGRRGNPQSDIVVEAVNVAKGVGQPVQVVWTREDDMHGGWYRPFFLHCVRGSLDAQGMPAAWRHTIIGQSIFSTSELVKGLIKDGVDPASVEGVSDMPYAIPNLLVDLHTTTTIVPIQWWRSAMRCSLTSRAIAGCWRWRPGRLAGAVRRRRAASVALRFRNLSERASRRSPKFPSAARTCACIVSSAQSTAVSR
jgi:isoquinoline 1-oxidoreductase beta subunit